MLKIEEGFIFVEGFRAFDYPMEVTFDT